MKSALNHTCEKYGCAKICLDPKLHEFDDCFSGSIRMGDIDGAVERNGHILWMEWKRGAVLEAFDKQFYAQILQAKAFTLNSHKQTFVFVIGDPIIMQIDAFRVIYSGKWRRDWQKTGKDGFKKWLSIWFSYADKKAGAA